MEEPPVLILGSSGFLGPHLVAAGLARGSRVVAAARTPARGPLPRGLVPGDLHPWDATRAGECERLLERVRPRAVVLAAALARVADCEREPALAERLNARLPAELARLCRARGARLVHVSTDLVFGARAPSPGGFREEDLAAPLHAYGRSKVEGEQAVLATWDAALVVRLPLLYGDSCGRGLGATDAILEALARGQRPTLFTDEWRTPLEVGNAARAVLELVDSDAKGYLHVAGPLRVSRLELGSALLAARGLGGLDRLRACTRADLGVASSRPADVSLDAARARARLETALLAPVDGLKAPGLDPRD